MQAAARSTVGAVAALALAFSSAAFAQSGNTSSSSSGSSFDQPNGLFDRTTHERHSQLSVMLGLAYGYGFGFGVGGRYTMPLLKDGFLDPINDSVELELGADYAFTTVGAFGFSYSAHQFDVAAEARWTFHLLPKLDAYAKLGIGPGFSVITGNVGTTGLGGFFFYFNGATGILYKLSDTLAFRAEVGSYGLRAGIGWDF